MSSTTHPYRNCLTNGTMVVVSFSIPFLILECALRTQTRPDEFNGDFDGVAGIGMPPTETLDLTWDDDGNSPVHFRSDNPRLVYEVSPNLDIYHGRIRTNSLGFRGPEVERDKPEDLFRICVIGDSVTFGWEQHEEDTYPFLMQRLLDGMESPDGRAFEVVNMGVGGYNAAQELEVIRTKALPLNPDLILVQYCVNDAEIGADAGLWHHFTSTGVPVVDFLRVRLMQARELFQLRDLVERSYPEIVATAEEHGVPVAFLFFPPNREISRYSEGMLELYDRHLSFVREQGWSVLCLLEPFDRMDDWSGLMADNYHPTPEGYALVASEIVAYLKLEGYVAPDMPFDEP